MDRGIPNQNKSPNYRYIKVDITCNIEAGESGTACNIMCLMIPYGFLSLFWKLIRTLLTSVFYFYFFFQNTEMKSSFSRVLVKFQGFGKFCPCLFAAMVNIKPFPVFNFFFGSRRGWGVFLIMQMNMVEWSLISIYIIFSPIKRSVFF